MLCLDTETTGLDHFHGAKPFLVTTCDEAGRQEWWEWQVDPKTREPAIPAEDVEAIACKLRRIAGWGKHDEEARERHALIGHNLKFDALALDQIGIPYESFPWPLVRDTMRAGHLLASNHPHNLTDMVAEWLGEDMEEPEKALHAACEGARALVRGSQPTKGRPGGGPLAGWRIAKKDEEDMPSVKKQAWKGDGWLPKEAARFFWEGSEAEYVVGAGRAKEERAWELEGWRWRPPDPKCEHRWEDGEDGCLDCGGHRWWVACRDYANADSFFTMMLWLHVKGVIRERGLWAIYLAMLEPSPVCGAMERRGVTVDAAELGTLATECRADSAQLGQRCLDIARDLDYELELPKTSNNGSLLRFCFEEAADKARRLRAERRAKKEREAEAKAAKLRAAGKGKRRGILGALLTAPKRPAKEEPLPREEGCLCLPVLKRTDTGQPALDKYTLEDYEHVLKEGTAASDFCDALRTKRNKDVSLGYLDSYVKYGEVLAPGWLLLHPSLNETATATLRMSCSNPNGQQVSKKETTCKACLGEGQRGGDACPQCHGSGKDRRSLRRCFGPAPGREWWVFDAKNIELRLPAYEAGEQEMINLFERGDEPPFYGSNHMLIFSILWPELWEPALRKHGQQGAAAFCKKEYESTQYAWTKGGDFAVQYGAVDRPGGAGTADKAYRKAGAQTIIAGRFAKQERLNQAMIKHARQWGFVETMPDKTVDPKRGYPLLCGRDEMGGGVRPTVPLNYHVQGSSMWWMCRAMVRVHAALRDWNRRGFDGHLVLQVHDELVLDVPRGGGAEPWRTNEGRMREVKRLMELGGEGLGVPTPVSCEWHGKSWAAGQAI